MTHYWIVLSHPRDGRHDEFNDWYENIHIRDIVRQPGGAAAQRFALTNEQIAPDGGARPDRARAYLALYELYDPALMMDVTADLFARSMRISDAFDFAVAVGGFYTAHAATDLRTAPPGTGDVLIERIARTDDPGFLSWYCQTRMPALAALPGVASAMITSYSELQALPVGPESHFVAIYRLTDRLAALARWGQAPSLPEGTVAEVACFTPVGQRITVHDVLTPTPEAAEAEAKAHESMGGRFYTAPPAG